MSTAAIDMPPIAQRKIVSSMVLASMSWGPSPEYADWWYAVSWKGIIWGGIATALAATTVVVFTALQFWSDGIRDQKTDERSREMELQLGEAKVSAAKANEAAAKATERTAALEVERLKMLKEFEWRQLTRDQAQAIGAFLKKRFDKLVVVSTEWDRESSHFALQLYLAAERAGVKTSAIHLDRPQGTTGLVLSGPGIGVTGAEMPALLKEQQAFAPWFLSPSSVRLFPDVASPTLYVAPRDPPYFKPGFLHPDQRDPPPETK